MTFVWPGIIETILYVKYKDGTLLQITIYTMLQAQVSKNLLLVFVGVVSSNILNYGYDSYQENDDKQP